jgi:CPA2 family monovalent cation:H+ antiporter-2
MESNLILQIFFLLFAALIGGILVKLLRLQPIVGFIIAGMIVGSLFYLDNSGTAKLAEIGTILLLFSIGLELSLARLKRIFKTAVLGGVLQITLTTLILFFLLSIIGFDFKVSLIFSLGFSLSSTALVVKMLMDRGEMDTIHGELMIGWLLIQDLSVIPIMIIITSLTQGNVLFSTVLALLKAVLVIVSVVVFGKLLAPFVIHKIASLNSRELLIVAAVALALGTALLTSFFGISPALGAFLAGIVISESQENHAVFAETRPLRDLFVALFFVTLGFIVKFSVFSQHFWLILFLVFVILILKFLIFIFISFAFGYHGRTAFLASIGLTQVGEFSFLIFSYSKGLNLLSSEQTSLGILVALTSIITTPILFKLAIPLWRKINEKSLKWPKVNKFITGWDRSVPSKVSEYKNHIIICGFGRVGSWIGKALGMQNIPIVVVDYNQGVIKNAKQMGIDGIYGDPSETEVLEQAGVKNAKAIVVAIPDRIAQEELITRVQTKHPSVKIYSRAHFDEDFERLKFLRVDKVVQPEFEAALTIIKSIILSRGKSLDDFNNLAKSLRQSKAMSKA